MGVNTHVEALNLRHLRALAVVIEEGSITAGARRLAVSQPALSQQLRSLEDFFGSRLLERLPNGIKPTALGRTLISEVRATLSTSERLIRHAKNAAGLEAGMLEIAVLPTLADTIMIDPIHAWQQLYPKVSIRIREFALQSAMVEEFGMGLGDMAVGVRPPNWQGTVKSLGWDQFVIVLNPDDPLIQSDRPVDLQELGDRNWVLYGRSNGLSDYVSAACSMAGFRPREAVRTSQVSVAVQLSFAGLGVALVPSVNIPENVRPFTRPLRTPLVWELAAFSRAEFTGLAEAFTDLLKRRDWMARPPGSFSLPGN